MGCSTYCIGKIGKNGNLAVMQNKKHKAVSISLPSEVWDYVKNRAESDGVKVPLSRVVAHAIKQLALKENRAAKREASK
jgi:hypothetical protein